MAPQILDVIADAADAELAEVGEVLANLRGVQVELLGQRLRRDGPHAGGVERVQAAQVDREPVGGQLGDRRRALRFADRARGYFVLLLHKVSDCSRNRSCYDSPRYMATYPQTSDAASAAAPATFQPYVPADAVARRVHRQGDRPRRAVRPDLRRVDRLPGPARRPDGQRLDPDRRARDLGAQAARRLDDPREQHRPDDRLGGRVGRRRRGLHRAGADLLRRRAARATSTTSRSRCWPSPAASSAC